MNKGWLLFPAPTRIRITVQSFELALKERIVRLHFTDSQETITLTQFIELQIEGKPVLEFSSVHEITPEKLAKFSTAQLDDGTDLEILHYHPSLQIILNPQKKIGLLHIPKTGGTSVNTLMSNLLVGAQQQSHVEGKKWFTNKNFDEVKTLQFFSGHISFSDFLTLSKKDFFFKTTILREPLAQLKSHINWVIKVSDNPLGSFYRGHNKHIQELSFKLRKIDFSNEVAVEKWINEMSLLERLLFSNCQTRYLIFARNQKELNQNNCENAKKHLGRFHLVGLTERMDAYFKKLSELLNWPEITALHENKNASTRFLDRKNGDVDTLLKKLITFDQEVYDYAKDHLCP